MDDANGGTGKMATLKNLIDMMRERGVLSLKHEGIEIVLTSEPVVVPEESREVAKRGKPGKDGMYADEQRDVYGRVIDAEE
jgi:hypothetical protein